MPTPGPGRKPREVDAVTRRILATRVAKKLGKGCTIQTALDVISATLDMVSDTLASGSTVEFRDFGIFEVVTRKARIGRNPAHPEIEIPIPQRRIVRFRPAANLRGKITKA